MKPTPKVLHIANTAWFLHYNLRNQLRSIEQDGYEVTVASPPGPETKAIEAFGFRHFAVPMTRKMSPFADLAALARLYRLMRRESFTIVHTHNPKPGLLGQLAARWARVPIVVNTLHGFYFHDRTRQLARRFYVACEKIAARCSDVILSQSQEDVQTALETRICRPDKIRYLGNGIDLNRFDRSRLAEEALQRRRKELGIAEGSPVIGFVGRLVAEKGVKILLGIVRQVRAAFPSARFLLIGPYDGDKADALTPAIAQEQGVADACIFPGMREDMPELYAVMDVFVLPSYREGFPRALMEASAMQVPCVATNIRGCREVVQPPRNGLLVPVGDVEALAAAVLCILASREQAREMGRQGRCLALQRFDEQTVFSSIKSEYCRLLHQKGVAAQFC